MSQQTLGIIIGGLIPAFLYGVSSLFAKGGSQTGIGIGPYLIILGLAVACVGVCFLAFTRDTTLPANGVLFTFGFGVFWGLGSGLVAIAISKYKAPLSQIVPLFNMNTLVTVLLALWIFAEWKDVHVLRLIAGAIFIVAGGTLVSL